jgi:hypothetical protein
MLDIIFNNRVFDPALVFGFGGFADGYQSLSSGSGNIASYLASKETQTIDAIDEFNAKLME